QCGRRRRAGGHDRRSRRFRAAAALWVAQRRHRAVDQLLHGALRPDRGVAGAHAPRHPAHGPQQRFAARQPFQPGGDSSVKQKLVVVGAGMASGRALEHLLEDNPESYDVTLFGAEPRGNYNRIMLSPVLGGEKRYDDIITHDAQWYARNAITCRFGETVTAIDRKRKVVASRYGETPYDKLLIATGSAPFIIPIAGKELPGVLAFRDLDDVDAMIAAAGTPGARA